VFRCSNYPNSTGVLGYYSQFRDQSITVPSIRRLVAAHVNAFPRTQLAVNLPNPEIARESLADDVSKKLAAPVGVPLCSSHAMDATTPVGIRPRRSTYR
jgi:hypothetical protein